MYIIGSMHVIVGDTDLKFKFGYYWMRLRRVTLSEQRPYIKKHAKKRGIYSKRGRELYTWVVYIYISCSNS